PPKRHKGRSVLTPNAVECIDIAKTFKESIYIAESSNRLEDYTKVFLDQIKKCSKTKKKDDTEMHQSGHPLLKFSHQRQKSIAIKYTISKSLLVSCLGVDYVKVIKGASNGNELLLVFEQIVETSRPDGFVLLERGDTFL
ncbi:unnamed protein product, partial [Porites evermanni]